MEKLEELKYFDHLIVILLSDWSMSRGFRQNRVQTYRVDCFEAGVMLKLSRHGPSYLRWRNLLDKTLAYRWSFNYGGWVGVEFTD